MRRSDWNGHCGHDTDRRCITLRRRDGGAVVSHSPRSGKGALAPASERLTAIQGNQINLLQ
jgi:hypothetical protein